MTEKPLTIYGQHDEQTIAQIQNCLAPEQAVAGTLLADGHLGYAMPIGGVVAYRNAVSPNGVGFDISCGVYGVRTDVHTTYLVDGDLARLADDIARTVPFGVGRTRGQAVDHPVFDDARWDVLPEIRNLKGLAQQQLGTVGSGNHYVDVLVDTDGWLWIAAHFGSRGLGHKIATGFLNLAAGRAWGAKVPASEDSAASDPVLLGLDRDLGQTYWTAMELAGRYAYAGREIVVQQVLDLLGTTVTEFAHTHHNFAWRGHYQGEEVIIVRKGATPLVPGRYGFVGGSMGDHSVVVTAGHYPLESPTLNSTVHGAGRIMSRSQAKGKVNRKTGEVKKPGLVSPEAMRARVDGAGVILRGGGLDEAPQVYRPLADVIAAMGDTVRVVFTLRPLIVCMAGADAVDPYRD